MEYYFDSVCPERGGVLVGGLVGVNHWEDLASPGCTGLGHLAPYWEPPSQPGLPPTLMVVGILAGFLPFLAIFLPSALHQCVYTFPIVHSLC